MLEDKSIGLSILVSREQESCFPADQAGFGFGQRLKFSTLFYVIMDSYKKCITKPEDQTKDASKPDGMIAKRVGRRCPVSFCIY